MVKIFNVFRFNVKDVCSIQTISRKNNDFIFLLLMKTLLKLQKVYLVVLEL